MDKIYFGEGYYPSCIEDAIIQMVKEGGLGDELGTFYDESEDEFQCYDGQKNRSFEDILALCKTYFPNTENSEVARELIRLHKEGVIGSFTCPDINKHVYFDARTLGFWSVFPSLVNAKLTSGMIKRILEEAQDKGKGKYSHRDVIEMAGFDFYHMAEEYGVVDSDIIFTLDAFGETVMIGDKIMVLDNYRFTGGSFTGAGDIYTLDSYSALYSNPGVYYFVKEDNGFSRSFESEDIEKINNT